MSYSTSQSVLTAARAAWTPRRPQRVSEWAATHRVVDSRTSALPGAWSNEATPYLVEVMDAFADAAVRKLVVMKCSQVGATEIVTNMIGWAVEHDPGPMLFVLPNANVARDVCRERVLPAIHASPAWKKHLGTEVEDEAGLRLNFDRCTLHFAGSNSPINVRSKPCKWAFGDDFDLCMAGTGEELSQRITTYKGGKLVETGTPGYEDAGIAAEYAASDKRQYWVPCPHCGVYQVLNFSRLKWDGGVKARPEDAARTTRYNCPHCRKDSFEHHKRGMLARGVWVIDGNHVEVVEGVARQAGPNKPGAVRGYHIVGEMSPFVPWSELVREFVAARGYPERVWWNGKLGRPSRTVKDRVDIADVERLCVKVADGGHEHGWVPEWALWLSAAVDVQGDRLWVQVDAWGPGMETSALVAFFQVGSRVDSKLAELTPWLDRGWPVRTHDATRRGAIKLRPWAWFIDSGWRTAEVYDFVRKAHAPKRRFVYASKGDGGGSPREFRLEPIDRYPDGTPMPQSVELLSVNSRIMKDAVMSMIRAASAKPAPKDDGDETPLGSEMTLPLAGSRRILPEDTPGAYLRHLTAEELVEKRERGVLVARWQLKQSRTDNHGLDTTYINAAGAIALGGRSLTVEHKPRLWSMANVAGPIATSSASTPGTSPPRARRPEPAEAPAPASSLATLYG